MWRCLLVAFAAAWLALSPAQAECFAGDAGFADTGGVLCGGANRPTVSFNFLSGVLDPRITFTRASAETNSLYTDAAGSTFTSFGNNVPVFQPTGLQIYEARTNFLLNSTAPALQTTGSLSTGTYVFWCIGTGNVTLAAGTAVGSGFALLNCSTAAFETITISVAGTVLVTPSGSVNRFQLELGAAPSPFIQTAGTTLARAADAATALLSSLGISANPTGLTIIAKAVTPGSVVSGHNPTIVLLDDGTTAHRLGLRQSSGSIGGLAVGAAGTGWNPTFYASVPLNIALTVWEALSPANSAGQALGQTQQADTLMTGLPNGLTTLRIGGAISANDTLNSTIARLLLYNRRIPNGRAAAIAAGL